VGLHSFIPRDSVVTLPSTRRQLRPMLARILARSLAFLLNSLSFERLMEKENHS
jgi:hypothetical protein